MPIRIVLGGGIGAGKTGAADHFSDLGALVIPADEAARSVLAPGTKTAEAVAQRWPGTVVEGVIDRALLGRTVFGDAEELAALEEMTHPETRQIIERLVSENAASDIVVEMPILRPWFGGWTMVVVDAPEEVRIARTVARESGRMTEEDVEAVIGRQPTRAEWLLVADYVIDNSGDRDHLRDECRRVWEAAGST